MAETDADVHSEGDEQRCYGEESAGNLCETEEVHYEILTMLARGNVINSGLPTWKVKKILRFLYLYCSIAVCSKKKNW